MTDKQDVQNHAFHILLAEDERQLLESMQYSLRREGYTVSRANNGTEALAIIKANHEDGNPIDLLVTDIQMPGMNGEDLVNAVRSFDTGMPILAITGFGNKEMVIRLLRRGCSDYLDKPFSSETFVQAVRLLIKQRVIANAQEGRSASDREKKRFLLERELDLLRAKYDSLHDQVKHAAGEFRNLVAIDPAACKTTLAFKNKPLQAMGGDFAAVKRTERGCIALVADVAGHDMAASFYTMVVKTFFDEHCLHAMSGSFMFELLNRALIESTSRERAVSATLLRLDFAEKWAEVTSAASPPVILLGKDDKIPRPIYAPGNILGMFDSVAFKSRHVLVNPGDRFFMYTDGLVSPFVVDGASGKKTRVLETGIDKLLLDHPSGILSNVVEKVWSDIAVACRNKFIDDALLLGIEIPEA